MSYVWPIAVIVIANVLYQICAKSVPSDMDVMASMIITYTVGAICSAVLYFVINRGGSLLQEFSKVNVAPFLLGVCVVGLEVGFLYAYKVGWSVSTASILQSALVAVALIFVGAILYKEGITANKLIGVGACLVGIFFINR